MTQVLTRPETTPLVESSPVEKTEEQLVAELLEQAADLIETDGWCSGHMQIHGRHCALGALADVGGYGQRYLDDEDGMVPNNSLYYRAAAHLARHVSPRLTHIAERGREYPSTITHAVISWNDVGTNGPKVIRTMRELAAKLVKEGK